MSKTINGFETAIVWGAETTQGTAPASYPYLWNSAESDSLSFGEEPLDEKILDGLRGQKSSTYRHAQNLPGGGLGQASIAFGTDPLAAILLLQSHFQQITETGGSAPYTYTATVYGSAIDDGSFHTLAFCKNVGVADKAHLYLGCIVDELEIGWESGGAIYFTPSGIKAMSSDNEATMPAIPASSTDGYIQAPNITVTWNGTEVQPAKWMFKGLCSSPDKQSGSARGRWGHGVGDYEATVAMDMWRSDSSDEWVDPFYANTVGTLVITGTMDTSYGTVAAATAMTFTLTAHCMVEMPNDLPASDGDIIDTVNLKVIDIDNLSVALTAASTGLL